MRQGNNQTAARYKTDNVGDNHQLIEHIAQFPNQIVGGQSAEEYEYQRDYGVNSCGDLLTLSILTEEVSHVDLAEHIPAENGGEREEEQRYGYEDVTAGFAKQSTESGLCKVGLVDSFGYGAVRQYAALGIKGDNNGQSSDGQNNKGIDEHTDHGNGALLMRILNVSLRMRMRGGTHTGFVGEQAALCALGYGLLYGYAERTADDGLGLKRIPEDHAESFGNLGDIGEEYNKTAKEIERSHNGDELFGNGSKTIHTAKEYEARYNNQRDTGYPGRNAKRGFHGGTDGVGLNHAAEETKGKYDGDGEEAGQYFT